MSLMISTIRLDDSEGCDSILLIGHRLSRNEVKTAFLW